MAKSRLGWLGPAIVLIGLAIGGLGVWFVVTRKPTAGVAIDTIKIDDKSQFVVRSEAGGDGSRSFVELVTDGVVKWQALVPRYAGGPNRHAISWSQQAVMVRVIRANHAEIFALSMNDASKLGGFRLAPNHGDIATNDTGPLTLSDHIRSYEIVNGPDWHQLVGIDIQSGRGIWRVELGKSPVTDAGLANGMLWLTQDGRKREFIVHNGAEKPDLSRLGE